MQKPYKKEKSFIKPYVLVVGRERILNRDMAFIIKEWGYSSWHASSGMEAIGITWGFETERRNLAIIGLKELDCAISGITFVEWLKRRYPDIKILMISDDISSLSENDKKIIAHCCEALLYRPTLYYLESMVKKLFEQS